MKVSEAKQAGVLLARRRCGVSYGRLWKKAVRSHVTLLLAMCVVAAVWWYGLLPATTFALFAGMVAGAIARDFGWFRGVRRSWPFIEKVIDWPKVEAIAQEGEQP